MKNLLLSSVAKVFSRAKILGRQSPLCKGFKLRHPRKLLCAYFCFMLMLFSHTAHALKQEDLLHPSKAFQFSAQTIAPDLIQLKWDIADGYYMYRKRFAFNSETEAISMNSNAALFPTGKIKQDPNLGEMEVYYDQVVIEVPLKRTAQAIAATEFKLKAKFQGCAEAGLCYPPQRKRATLTLAALTQSALTPPTASSNTSNATPAEVVSLTSLKTLRANKANIAGSSNNTNNESTPSTAIEALPLAANDAASSLEALPLPPISDAGDNATELEALPLPPISNVDNTAPLEALPLPPISNVDNTASELEALPLPPIDDAESGVTALPLPTDGNTSSLTADKTANELLTSAGRLTAGKEPLPVEQAFRYTLTAVDQKTLVARWQIAPDHNLYRKKTSFSIVSPTELTIGSTEFPAGNIVNDEFFGEVEVYGGDVSIIVSLQNTTAKTDEIIIETRFQGCSNASGICYPLTTKQTTLYLADLPETAPTPVQAEHSKQEVVSSTSITTAQEDFFSGSFFGTLLAFFVVGLGLSLTPCIFPMIPILSGIIAGQTNLSASKAFTLSLTYVVASASAYALIGLAFGFFGENLQSGLQNPIAIGLFSALFVILALSMFGFYDLQMPNSIQSRLNELSNRQRSGSLLGAAIMGFLSTLIVGPCVAPALAAALTYIADSKDAVLGASALFSMGLGMGMVLLVAGTLGGHLLPKAGGWMDTTKAIFGIMLLGMAIWMLNRIVPLGITMLLSGVLLVASGIYMGALDRLNRDASGWDRFWKSMGLILLFFGSAQLLGVATGSNNILQPLKGVLSVTVQGQGTSITAQQQAHVSFKQVKSNAELDSVLADARQNRQLVLLDFYADWCVDCIRMEKNAFSDAKVQQTLKNVILLQADVTKRDEQDKALEKRFNIIGPPTIIFFDYSGQEIKGLRMIGYENTTQFMQRISQFTSL